MAEPGSLAPSGRANASVSRARILAAAPALAFAALAAVTAGVGAVPPADAVAAALSVVLALIPSGWVAPGGWHRRAAEAAAIPAAFALVMVGDPTLRRMTLPPLLALAALAACTAALRRASRSTELVLSVALALAVRAAGGLGLVGISPARGALALATAGLVAAAAARALGGRAALVFAFVAGSVPLERAPVAIAALLAGAAALAVVAAPRLALGGRVAGGWASGALALGFVATALAPWGGIAITRGWPGAGRGAAVAGAAALVATPLLPAGAAGALWLSAAALVGPSRPPPDRPAFRLTEAHPEAALPACEGGPYVVDVTLANGAGAAQGSLAATVHLGAATVPIRAGMETAEWAHERPDVRGVVAHSLPFEAVWRPAGVGGDAAWGAAGRIRVDAAPGTPVRVTRAPTLPPGVDVIVATAGSSRPTPPRDWPARTWILAAALAVAALQLVSGTWRSHWAAVPWGVLIALAVAARTTVAPLALLAERHSVDLALAALLAAWLPAARVWLARGRAFVAASALLVPLAVAAAHLMPPGGDAQYHLVVLRSLSEDHDLDLSNNYDLEHHPENFIYVKPFLQPSAHGPDVAGTPELDRSAHGSVYPTPVFLHSPGLAFLLLPGYAAAGLPGALVTMALLGAGLVAGVARGAARLGLPRKRVALLVGALLATYPLVTFATQIWVEVPGALLAALALLSLGEPRPRIGVASLASLAATSLKARLALATFPLPMVALASRRHNRRELVTSLLVVGAASAAGLAFGVLVYGHPIGPFRSPASILPRSLGQPVVVLAGIAFDSAAGVLFSAPLLALGLGGSRRLWREGGAGERGALLAGALTVAALLNSPEWYGGGCPPVRYLVPLLPALGLSAASVLRGAARWRRLGFAVLPAAFAFWWVMVTRPHLGFNSGDGGSWLADALAHRFAADARHLFPSFLRISPATYLAPAVIVVAGGLAILACTRSPQFARAAGRLGVPLWLVAASALLLVLGLRTDRVVEIGDPQVAKSGGVLVPPLGTASRFSYPNGWRLEDGNSVDVPLNLPPNARLRLQGRLEGTAESRAEIRASWDGGPAALIGVTGADPWAIAIPDTPGPGRHRLRLALAARPGAAAVLERVLVGR